MRINAYVATVPYNHKPLVFSSRIPMQDGVVTETVAEIADL